MGKLPGTDEEIKAKLKDDLIVEMFEAAEKDSLSKALRKANAEKDELIRVLTGNITDLKEEVGRYKLMIHIFFTRCEALKAKLERLNTIARGD